MIIGVSITKETTWRGKQEQFSNVYHFDTSVDTTSDQVIDSVVSTERTIHSPNVKFVNAKAFGPTDGTKEQNVMLADRPLNLTGTADTSGSTAQELAAVVQWDTGRKNTRGGRIFLRKYLHVGALAIGQDEASKGNTPMNAQQLTKFQTFGKTVQNAVGVNAAPICDAKGRKLPLSTEPQVLPHLHTRQFRR
jgi:hypothetical protein